MSKPLKMTPLMKKYYNRWINTPTLLGNPHDEDKYFQFIKACIKYGRMRRSGSWLRGFLEKDINRFCGEYKQNLISRAVSIFDCIVEYENIEFPVPLVEQRDPASVSIAMSQLIRGDGTRFYTDQEIEAFIQQCFKRASKEMNSEK